MLVGAGLGSGSAYGADRTVGPGKTYATIQAAYNAADSGDTITVDDGTYAEDGGSGYLALTSDKNITIRSASGTATGVIVKAASSTSTVVCHTNGNLTLENLTIDGTGLTSISFGALHSNASSDNVTCTGCIWQNVPVPAKCFYNITGSNGTITFTGCTIAGGEIGLNLHATTTALVIDSTTITPAASGSLDCVAINTLSTVGSLTISNGSVLTAPLRSGLYIDKDCPSVTISDSTITGGTSANADAIHLNTADTVGTLSISGSTITCRGASGTCGALEIGGTATTLKITNGSTLDGGANGVGLLGYDGANFGMATWIYARDSTFTSSGMQAIYLQRSYNQIDIRDCTITSGDNGGSAAVFGTDPADTDADNPAPMGNLFFWGNTVTKTGTDGHCVLFGNGCGYGSIIGNTFIGGDWGLVIKGSRLHVLYNGVYTSASTPAATLASAQNCVFAHNTVVNGGGTAFHMGNDARTTTPPSALYNTVVNNVCQSTGGVALALDAGEYDDCVLDYNCYWRTDAGNLATVSGTACADLAAIRARWLALYAAETYGLNDAASVSVFPGVMHPSGGVFAVSPGSPVIGAGLGSGTMGSYAYPGYDPRWIDAGRMPGGPRRGRD